MSCGISTRHGARHIATSHNGLRQMADRIQSRAVRRCGELLKQFDGRGDHRKSDGAVISSTQRQAAEDAGMSERQRVTSVRVANVPADDFEALVEGKNPPTVTRLADMGASLILQLLVDFLLLTSDFIPQMVEIPVLCGSSQYLQTSLLATPTEAMVGQHWRKTCKPEIPKPFMAM